MSQESVKDKALASIELLKKVVDFKMKFYPRAWAKYIEAVPGTLRLMPSEERLIVLQADYEAMKDMLYGEIPSLILISTARKIYNFFGLIWKYRLVG